MPRLRADLNPDFKNHPLLEKVRKEILKRTPDSMVSLLFDVVEHPGLNQYCNENGIPPDSVTHYWHKGKQFSVFAKTRAVDYFQIREGIVDEMKLYSPVYPEIQYIQKTNPHLLVISPADIHLGKLASVFETGNEYSIKTAYDRALEGVRGILTISKPYNIDQILLVGGNDALHIDTPKRTTTAGTPQDTDGMWYDAFNTGKDLFIEVIEILMQIAPVHVVWVISNHDYMSGFFLADTLASWFDKCSGVTFDIDMKPRKFYRYHSNLIGVAHGDTAKQEALPLLMAQESGEWDSTKHRYYYLGHEHRKISRDFPGCTVETVRSPSSADGWHSRHGYLHSPKAVEGFLHDPNHGQIARFTHIF